MNANAYAKKIEQSFPDEKALKAVREEIQADASLDENAKGRLSDRVGGYLAHLAGETT
jgi:hypothetical protein